MGDSNASVSSISPAVIMTKYGMNGKKDSHLTDTNYIKDGTESDTLDDPRLEKLWSKVGKISRNCSVGNKCFFSSESLQSWDLNSFKLC